LGPYSYFEFTLNYTSTRVAKPGNKTRLFKQLLAAFRQLNTSCTQAFLR